MKGRLRVLVTQEGDLAYRTETFTAAHHQKLPQTTLSSYMPFKVTQRTPIRSTIWGIRATLVPFLSVFLPAIFTNLPRGGRSGVQDLNIVTRYNPSLCVQLIFIYICPMRKREKDIFLLRSPWCRWIFASNKLSQVYNSVLLTNHSNSMAASKSRSTARIRNQVWCNLRLQFQIYNDRRCLIYLTT